MFKKVKDYAEVRSILPAYIATSFIKLEDKELIQVNLNSFIRLIHNVDDDDSVDNNKEEKEKDNILILQGGVVWSSKQSFYLKTLSSYFTENVRVFVFEKCQPAIDMNYTDDIIDAMNYIRNNYTGKLAVIGYSMGGLLLSAYLAKSQAKEADLFILCCNSFNYKEFREVLNTHNLFKWIQSKDLAAFNANTLEELLEKEEVDIESQEYFMNHLIEFLNKTRKYWHKKMVHIIGKTDPITQNYKKDLKKFEKRPHTIVCKKGWHCCSEVTQTAIEFAYEFFDKSNLFGKNCNVKDLI